MWPLNTKKNMSMWAEEAHNSSILSFLSPSEVTIGQILQEFSILEVPS
jgi:hypothetical protein